MPNTTVTEAKNNACNVTWCTLTSHQWDTYADSGLSVRSHLLERGDAYLVVDEIIDKDGVAFSVPAIMIEDRSDGRDLEHTRCLIEELTALAAILETAV